MKVLVLGAGVIGVTTAYYLVRAGHDVEVIERRENVAMETSFANAGQISPGYASPWAGPGIPLKALKWLMMRHGPLIIRPKANAAMWRWLYDMLHNCTAARYAVNKGRMVPLAEYSRDCLRDLRTESGITYDHGNQGTLQLLRTSKQFDAIAKDIEVLRQFGVSYKALDRKGCIEAEPGLAHASADFVGGLRLPRDETGDCQLFTLRLAQRAAALGVRFSFETKLYELKMHNGTVTRAMTSNGPRVADAYVVALGSHAPAAVTKLGLKLPVYPVKGYSLTVPVSDPSRAPSSTVMDETYKIAITRLGDRIRIGGTAELAGYDLSLRSSRRAALSHSFGQLFPGSGDLARARFWCGLRPMTPDGTPIIGSTPVRRLYLNTGHGTLGWTMACGSARVITDIVSGNSPDLDVKPLNLSRYG